jgi:hypothetical protein
VVSAYDTAGVESAYSEEAVFTAPGVLPNFVPGRNLVWRNTASVQVGLWIMNGTNIAQSPIIGSTSLDWQIIGSGNFTGNPGILWVNSNTGQLGVWSVNGNATPGVATFAVGGSGVTGTVQAIGNFGENATSDLIVHDSQTGGTWMATNQGALRFSTSFLGSVDRSWKIVGIADLGATGTPQLIWQNASTRQLSPWFFSNGSLVASPIINTIPAQGWKITAFGAVDGQGKADIVWQNRSGGAVDIWETDGQNVTSIESPGRSGPPWRTVAAEWDSLSEQQRGGPEYLEEHFRRKRLDMERQRQFFQYRKDSHGAHPVGHSAKPAGQPLTGCERTG